MLKHVIVLISLLMFFSCREDITVTISKEPGKITGLVKPLGVTATIELYQGNLVARTSTDNAGIFVFDEVKPGVYRLIVRAESYGKKEIHKIQVADGEGYDIGVINLSRFPYPLINTSPFDGGIDAPFSFSSAHIYLIFAQHMNLESVKQAVKLQPALSKASWLVNSSEASASHYYFLEGDFDYGTFYTMTIDTIAETYLGEKLEFPYSMTFQTEYFQVTEINSNYSETMPAGWIRFEFNGQVESTILEYLTIEPATPMRISSEYPNRLGIMPILTWAPDTVYSVRLSKEFHEEGGAKLQKDTTFTFKTFPLRILNTKPYDKQYFVNPASEIQIEMNNLLNEATIEKAVSISPAVSFAISTMNYRSYTYFKILPDTTLESNMHYTVNIDTSLQDYYGKKMKQPYSFSFTTN